MLYALLNARIYMVNFTQLLLLNSISSFVIVPLLHFFFTA